MTDPRPIQYDSEREAVMASLRSEIPSLRHDVVKLHQLTDSIRLHLARVRVAPAPAWDFDKLKPLMIGEYTHEVYDGADRFHAESITWTTTKDILRDALRHGGLKSTAAPSPADGAVGLLRELFYERMPLGNAINEVLLAAGKDELWRKVYAFLAAQVGSGTIPSLVRINADNDPTYYPYCLRCSDGHRMVKVGHMQWKCPACPATHDERTPAERAARTEGGKP